MEKIFNLVSSRVEAALQKQGYKKLNQNDKNTAIFVNENMSYSVFYNIDRKQFELRTSSVEDGKPTHEWKRISAWLFDPEVGTQRDAESIARDFEETIGGPKKTAFIQAAEKKKKSSSDERNIGILFFVNRLVNIFPELKDDIKIEKECYETFRTVTFTEEKILPKIEAFFNGIPRKNELKKLGTILSDAYKVGDMDVRGAITMLILNSIENEENQKKLQEYLSEDLKKAWSISIKLKGKKIKPEKVKKTKNIMAKTLNS